jgi:hypothetical protein
MSLTPDRDNRFVRLPLEGKLREKPSYLCRLIVMFDSYLALEIIG